MIVAEINLCTTKGFATGGFSHRVGFDDLAIAYSEFDRVATLLKRREERSNDMPKDVVLDGSGSKLSVPLDDLCSVALIDFAKANEQHIGLKDTYPLLFK